MCSKQLVVEFVVYLLCRVCQVFLELRPATTRKKGPPFCQVEDFQPFQASKAALKRSEAPECLGATDLGTKGRKESRCRNEEADRSDRLSAS